MNFAPTSFVRTTRGHRCTRGRRTAEQVAIELEFRKELEMGVGSIDAVTRYRGITARHESADVRISEEIPLDSADEKLVRTLPTSSSSPP